MPYVVMDYNGDTVCVDLKKVLYMKSSIYTSMYVSWKSSITIVFQGGETVEICFSESDTAQAIIGNMSNGEWY